MILEDVLAQLEGLDDGDVIVAAKPWQLDSKAIIGQLDADYKVPASILATGMEYFLEVTIAKEALEVFGDCPPTLKERYELLMYYAENDAFPDWVYQR